jgi:hypothetical protein
MKVTKMRDGLRVWDQENIKKIDLSKQRLICMGLSEAGFNFNTPIGRQGKKQYTLSTSRGDIEVCQGTRNSDLEWSIHLGCRETRFSLSEELWDSIREVWDNSQTC